MLILQSFMMNADDDCERDQSRQSLKCYRLKFPNPITAFSRNVTVEQTVT